MSGDIDSLEFLFKKEGELVGGGGGGGGGGEGVGGEV